MRMALRGIGSHGVLSLFLSTLFLYVITKTHCSSTWSLHFEVPQPKDISGLWLISVYDVPQVWMLHPPLTGNLP